MRGACLFALAAGASSCATPSRGEMAEHAAEAKRIMRAHAVHMPPGGVESCVGVTVRLTESNPGAERERALFAARLGEAEIEAAMGEAGVAACREGYLESLEAGGVTPEPLQLRLGYGVDPDGRVCAVVERDRPDPIDPAAVPLIEDAAACLKDALFRARFPAGRVEDRERIIRFYELSVDPNESVRDAP